MEIGLDHIAGDFCGGQVDMNLFCRLLRDTVSWMLWKKQCVGCQRFWEPYMSVKRLALKRVEDLTFIHASLSLCLYISIYLSNVYTHTICLAFSIHIYTVYQYVYMVYTCIQDPPTDPVTRHIGHFVLRPPSKPFSQPLHIAALEPRIQ